MKALRALSGITLVNVFVAALALATSPLQARALGPDGRGDLAAFAVTFGLIPIIVDFGFLVFAARATAMGVSARRLLGTLVPITFGIGLVVAALAWPIATLVADGRDDVFRLVLIGVLLMPVLLAATVANGINWGRQDWRLWSVVRLIPPVGLVVVYVALYVTDEFTVERAGLAVIVLAVLAILPLLPLCIRAGRAPFDRDLAKEATAYGSKVWVSTITTASTARLDQLLMVRLVSSSELGWYVVATNISSLQGIFLGAVLAVLFPRVAQGELHLIGRAFRVTILATAALSLVLALLAGVAVPVLFGDDFRPVIGIAHVLLVAAVPQAGMFVLAQGLQGAGHPGVAGKAHALSLGITVPALFLLVGSTGAIGAAYISLAGYTIALAYLAFAARSRVGVSLRELVVPRRTDFVLPGRSR